jgi:hypothetical protein
MAGMRIVIVLAALVAAGAAQAAPSDAKIMRTLKLLEPTERLEQLCDYAAMQYIRKNLKAYRPDRALAGAISEPVIKQHTIEAKGGAFRSRKQWYEMSYTCTADAEHLNVLSINLKVGEEIPESKWAGYGLWQ